MNTLQAGFARVNVTPMMGIGITGYYKPRFVKGVRDELELSALALTCGQTRLVLLSMDHCGIHTPEADPIRAYVAEKTGLPDRSRLPACDAYAHRPVPRQRFGRSARARIL